MCFSQVTLAPVSEPTNGFNLLLFFFLPVQLNYEFEGPEMFIAEEYFSDYSLFSRHLNMFQMSRFSIEIWIFLTKKKT